jgi:protein phosphatase
LDSGTQFQWTSAARSHIGLVRTRNEDAVLALPERGLWAVADGMGGHAAGDVASRAVVDALSALPRRDNLSHSASAVREQLHVVNRQLRIEAAKRGVPIVGSTAVALLARDLQCVLLWAGDSRAYRWRKGALLLLTRDHNQGEDLKARSHFDSMEFLSLQNLNMLTRAIGASDTLELDEQRQAVADGDVFLLCSDGLSNAVQEQDIQSTLAAGDCAQAADALIGLALQGGGRDNISVVVVHASDAHAAEKTMVNPAL